MMANFYPGIIDAAILPRYYSLVRFKRALTVIDIATPSSLPLTEVPLLAP